MSTTTDPNPPTVKGGIGAAVTRIDGPLKVTGGAKYASDMTVTNPAFAYFHTSAIALGTIIDIDEGDAHAVPGVIDIMTWHSVSGQLNPIKTFSEGGTGGTKILMMQGPEIRHDGEIIAVILAETYEAARDASHRLIVRYEERDPVATFGDEGLVAEDATLKNPMFKNVKVGDADAALSTAFASVDQQYSTQPQHHNPIELFTTTAFWQNGELTIYEPSQYMVGTQHGVAEMLGIDPARVRVISHFVGGAFGSKASVTDRTAIVALAAKRLNRPVKLVATRDQGFTIATYRAETQHHVRLGADMDGKITALIHEADEVSSQLDSYKVGGTDMTTRMYAIPNITSKVTIQHADRNTPGFMRAPAEVPYMFALESAVDELAYALKIDPVELRRINDAQIEPVGGLPYSSRSLNECYATAAAAFGWGDRNPEPMSTVDGDWQIGWGCATACYPANIAACFARITLTATDAIIEVAGHEIGTGAYTIYAQTAADRLGLPLENIKVLMGDSRLPPAPVAGGSNNAASVSNAVALGCAMVRARVAAAAVADPTSPLTGRVAAKLTLADGTLRDTDGTIEPLADALARLGGAVEMLAGNEPDSVKPGSLAGLRSAKLGFGGGFADPKMVKASFGAEFVEVRVHRLTREVRVSRIVGAFAAGTIMNPITARSQLMGGMIWGISSALHEATEIDHRNARYTNDNLAEYLIPVNADIPNVEVLFVAEIDRDVNPLGIKGVGELGGVGTDAAVCNAIYHATGVRIRDLPVRIEKLLGASA